MSIQEIKKDAETRMKKSIESLKGELTRLRTGRASAGLLDHVMIDYYNAPTPLAQVASVSVADARSLVVTPWEKNLIPKIDKAIRDAGLGLNPVAGSDNIRVPLPALSEERRKEMVKVVRQEGEGARVAIRNIRRDSISQVKDLHKQKVISEDEERQAEEAFQKLTDRFVDEVDAVVEAKEADLMEV
ncbi:ribosome recycling factor [Acidithiobacillus thiooxidans]|jgi:ribosome recycling factor|uniref:Ribosome-recycling factor n=2 Tax=Acidithiobacillus thiooxidans TaxID=930 RepID=A0A1C2J7A7_ACITH|nr:MULTISPECIES: ribosome recycling factor [Acidithiobacillus]MBE7562087.1 ribosome recycling factor [Acidithiobacillus sp. HP-6]MBE7565622.1 ribosome recycling factor [Acidithiobacillus sp. HP-11]MBE7568801.1 ribosome recycling factor [Acidithiobacillus sp. HP-2]MBU2751285.1 ribosome recycling factor [Acidithiobacillus thiooxidans]MBU2792926.1 ribosome recycling factor [Acidithiobacillus thiooxidans]